MVQRKPIYGGSSSPDGKVPKNLTHILNISSKFTGTGGNTSSLAPKRPVVMPKKPISGIFEAERFVE